MRPSRSRKSATRQIQLTPAQKGTLHTMVARQRCRLSGVPDNIDQALAYGTDTRPLLRRHQASG